MVKLQYALFKGLKYLEIVQVLDKSAGRHFSTKLIKVQVLNKSMQVGIIQKINKICCTFIRDTRVDTWNYGQTDGWTDRRVV